MNNFNIPPDKLNSLLQTAGQKLGRSPEELRGELESGKLDNVLSGLDANTANKVNGLLQNPKALETMLQNPQVQGLLKNLMGGQK